jgi:hypothetical protein
VGQIINFTERKKNKLWAVWVECRIYYALDITGKSKEEIILVLPTPTPNYTYQFAPTSKDAILQIQQQEMDVLL